jgi:hypothetical protein
MPKAPDCHGDITLWLHYCQSIVTWYAVVDVKELRVVTHTAEVIAGGVEILCVNVCVCVCVCVCVYVCVSHLHEVVPQ